MSDDVEQMKAEIKRLTKLAADRAYMLVAYRNMLGPKALEVVNGWDEKGIHRVHFDWSGDALNATGEDRAQMILDTQDAIRSAASRTEIDSHLQTVPYNSEFN